MQHLRPGKRIGLTGLSSFESLTKVVKNIPICRRLNNTINKHVTRTSSFVTDKHFPKHDYFEDRHIGPSLNEQEEILQYLGFKVSAQL